jgi:hypothetical protein
MSAPVLSEKWTSGLIDAVAFAAGLMVAWWAGWNTGDLVWSLWLSSFMVGYATIVWMIARPVVALLRASWRDRALVGANPRSLIVFGLLIVTGASIPLAFFTVHFGGFHYVHSQFLISFFPADLPGSGRAGWAGRATYLEVLRRYWPFLPSAFLAHRGAFMKPSFSISRNDAAKSFSSGNTMTDLVSEPYRNVMRLHALIFFFFFAHLAHLENFAVYAVVYAVYFFPWRLVRKPVTQPAPISVQ